MAFEELPTGVRYGARKSAWTAAIGKNGQVRIGVPRDHDMEKAKGVKTLIGKDGDYGWVRLQPYDAGRKLHKAGKGSRLTIVYSTLPGAPKARMVSVELVVREHDDGSVDLRLPWVKMDVDGRPERPGVVAIAGDRSAEHRPEFSMTGPRLKR